MRELLKISWMCLLPLGVMIMTGATFARNLVWQNEMVLWEDAAGKSPNKGRVHHNLGRAYDMSRFPREAFAQYLIATSLDPGLAKAHESLGISYVGMGETNKARQQFEIALQLDPTLLEARTFLAYVLQQGNP